MNMRRTGQLRGVEQGDRRGQVAFLACLFGVAVVLQKPTGCATRCREDVNRLHERVQFSRILAGLRRGIFPRSNKHNGVKGGQKHFTDKTKLVAQPMGKMRSIL